MNGKTTAVSTGKPADMKANLADRSLVVKFATMYSVEPERLLKTLKATAFKAQKPKDGNAAVEITDEQMMALLVVANEYHLNPFTREIYAFPAKGGGIVPIISIDGWIRIINERPELKSIAFDYSPDDAEEDDVWIDCTITRSDRDTPITVREWLRECRQNTQPWDEMPRRMLRHKVLIQCARVAFGYGGVYDPDEAERIAKNMAIDGSSTEVRGKPVTREPQARIQGQPPQAAALTHDEEAQASESSNGNAAEDADNQDDAGARG